MVINDPQKAEAFISAIEASIADPYKTEDKSKIKIETDPNTISHITDIWKKEVVF